MTMVYHSTFNSKMTFINELRDRFPNFLSLILIISEVYCEYKSKIGLFNSILRQLDSLVYLIITTAIEIMPNGSVQYIDSIASNGIVNLDHFIVSPFVQSIPEVIRSNSFGQFVIELFNRLIASRKKFSNEKKKYDMTYSDKKSNESQLSDDKSRKSSAEQRVETQSVSQSSDSNERTFESDEEIAKTVSQIIEDELIGTLVRDNQIIEIN
ncbi:DFP2 [Sarcoptes scabiei]|nr:DFP2 [Sarcoptes scabiei]